ncbi:Zinc finger CCCH domain-containing protein 16 [Quillaja saponaria]|uniref:Zinc finger CCCH domain-containing protein 16 n=1 Tax=Quillaja saponaria TaxID=32244 RepID=A0AAD7PRT8_QUISA|nr:Zinc finger CCCH domain-containing protein 16 [Quillaja saponaria]
MHKKREPCRYFQRGNCQYGERCKFLHVVQQQPKSNVSGVGMQNRSYQQQKTNPFEFGMQNGSHQQPKTNPFGFGVQNAANQQEKTNPFAFGSQIGSHGYQKPNPVSFGGQNNSHSKEASDFGFQRNQHKPFNNKWTRGSSGGATHQLNNHPQAVNHKCTDPETCRREIVEDFEKENPLWKLTCYSHCKNAPCDIVGDISYEELRAAAYDDAKRGMSLQSIVEKERNLLNSKLAEFEKLISRPYAVPPTPSPSLGASAKFSQNTENVGPPSITSFSQLSAGSAPNFGFGTRHTGPANNAFVQHNSFQNQGLTDGRSQTQTPGSSLMSNVAGVTNSGITASNPFFTPGVQINFPSSPSNQSPITLLNNPQVENASGDSSIWLKENWVPGDIPEEAPPDAYIREVFMG